MTDIAWTSPEGPLPATAARMRDRVVLVTGAASGIGEAVARLFLAEGASVIAFDRDEQGLGRLPAETACRKVAGSVTEERDVDTAVADAIAAFGRLDGVVNAAGVHSGGSLRETSPLRFREVLDINLTGSFLVCRAAAPHLEKAGHATIVNMSSASALSTFPNRSAYAASKGGLIAMSKSMAMELAPRVRVNVIAPGLVDTPMARAIGDAGAFERAAHRHALGRVGHVAEVAQAALYLASPASSFVTGITLAVDGGRTFH